MAPPTASVGARVRKLAAACFAGEVITATDPVAGTAWLAVRRALPDITETEFTAIHKRLNTAS